MKLSLLLAISVLPLTGPQMLALARQNPSPQEVQRRFPGHWYPGRVARMQGFLSNRNCDNTHNHVVFLGQEEYPHLLAEEENPPFRLFYRGRLPKKDEQLLSICGTRKADLAGESASYALALEAGANRVSVVTSHSQGIDRAALYAAGDGGFTAFVPCDCGLDTPRIVQNRLLKGMNLLSAFEPDDSALRFRCLSRNVLTAALSPLLVVVEAPARSGSLHCASLALDMGREVVVHHSGLRDLPWCSGTRQLAEDGCPVVGGYAEIANFLDYRQGRCVIPPNEYGPLYRYGNSCYSLSNET
jgi:DNA processing protein